MSEGFPQQKESFDSLKTKAESLAMALSHKLIRLPKDDLSWQSEDANLAHLYMSNEPGGKSGVQHSFEERIALMSGYDEGQRYHSMFQYVEDLKRLNNSADRIIFSLQR